MHEIVLISDIFKTPYFILNFPSLVKVDLKFKEAFWLRLVSTSYQTKFWSGPDQIILVLKISTEPIRSWCCLHIITQNFGLLLQ